MNETQVENKIHKTGIILFLLVLVMFGVGYALVPFYDVICKQLGINGKPGGQAAMSNVIDESRWVTVQFIANKNSNLPWKFYPLTQKIVIHPGQNTKVAFFAQNDSDKTMVIQAIPSVTPGLAAVHLKKTECFCFNRQLLKSGQSMNMPIIFHLDTALPKDMNVVTLSYTLFDVTHIPAKKNQLTVTPDGPNAKAISVK